MERPPRVESRIEDELKIERLESYLKSGYLLHGGKRRLEMLEPRQATDSDPERTTGKAFAIYAEDTDVRVPVVMALFDRKDPSVWEWRSGYSAHGIGSTMTLTGKNCTFTKGYVHVLPRESFEREGDEHDNELISRKPVEPVDIIEVTPSIIDSLKGMDIQIEE
jgi:hypothetical protein